MIRTSPVHLVITAATCLGCALQSLGQPPSSLQQDYSLGTDILPVNRIGDGYVELTQCFTSLISDVEVPAQESGPLVSIQAREGEFVEQGRLLAQINDQLAQLRLETAQTKLQAATEKASSDIDIQAAENALQIAERERQSNLGLFNQGAMAKYDYDRSVLASKQAALQLEQAKRDVEAAAKDAQVETHNVSAAKESIARHLIQSPIDGNVLEVFKDPGEWVDAGENVLRVARLDRLYVQGLVDSRLFNPHEIDGRHVSVTLKMARDEKAEFEGRVVHVALEKNSTAYYSVRAEVENRVLGGRWTLLTGEEVSMRIHFEHPSVGSSAPSQNR